MTRRRDFLSRTGYASAAMALLGPGARRAQAALSGAWGVQLYTVRDLMATKAAETLKAVAALGYREVETLRRMLPLAPLVRDAGLATPSLHMEAPIITGEWAAYRSLPEAPFLPPETYNIEAMIADAAKIGIRFLNVAYLEPEERTSLDFYRRLADAMNRAGEKCTAAGLVLGFHNHAFEYESLEGRRPMDVLLERCDPKHVSFELDVFWLSMAGLDPAKTIRDLGSRVKLLHLKDRAEGSPNTFDEDAVKPGSYKEVGSGVVDFKAVLAAAKAVGVEHAFVEQDHTPGDPLASLGKSFNYLSKLPA